MNFEDLTRYEREELLAALRRDMRAEEARAGSDPQWADFHRANARRDVALLQALNPKHTSADRAAQGHRRYARCAKRVDQGEGAES